MLFNTIHQHWLLNFKPKVSSAKGNVILPILNSPGKYIFYCPGCEQNHLICTIQNNSKDYHVLTGTLSKPTVRASILSKGKTNFGNVLCHSFITEGKIEFLSDCTHKLAGKSVDLPIIGQ